MADLYLDNDVSRHLVPLLEDVGHHCATALDLGLEAAGDEVQLLTAVQRGAILITYNRQDFMMLHRAWHLWPPEFDTAFPPHNGILTVDQVARAAQFAVLQEALTSIGERVIKDQMLWWHAPAGWRVLADQEWVPIT